MRAIVFAPLAILFSTAAYAADAGMFLCRSPLVANDFWTGLVDANQAGVKLDKQIAADIAKKNSCHFLASNNLKPLNFVDGQFEITDGKQSGWASPQLFIMYANRPPIN